MQLERVARLTISTDVIPHLNAILILLVFMYVRT